MKKIAIIADIHGNYSALKAVLRRIDDDKEIENIYCLGDLIGIGHETNEVLELMFSRNDISFVLGNHDEAVIKLIEGMEPESKGEEKEHHKWVAERLDEKFISRLKSIPFKLNVSLNGKKLLFQHYHLNENNKFLSINKEPTVKQLDEIYRNTETDVVCFGHHHMVHHFKSKQRLYLNPSSLGCNHRPIAEYTTLFIGNSGELKVSFIEVPYDNKDFLLSFKKKKVPASDFILNFFYGNQHLNYS